MGDDHLEIARFGDYDHIGFGAIGDDVERPKACSVLLRDHTRKDEIAGERNTGALQPNHRIKLRRDAGLHVACAPGVELTINDVRLERALHVPRRNRIDVSVEHETLPAAAAGKNSDHVTAPVPHFLQLRLDALSAQEVANVDGDWRLVARRIAVRLNC